MFCSCDYTTVIKDLIAAVPSTYPKTAYTVRLYSPLGLCQHIYMLIQKSPRAVWQWLGSPVREEDYVYQDWGKKTTKQKNILSPESFHSISRQTTNISGK